MSQAIQSLIHRECRLLDLGRLDEWLALYTDDATYWVPIDENADPLKDSSVIYDDRMRMAVRVEQIMRHNRASQSPNSQTMRMATNLEITESGEASAEAHFSMLLVELRSGDWRQQGLGETRVFPGHCTMRFRAEKGTWKIVSKKLVLLNRMQPIVGLSFLL